MAFGETRKCAVCGGELELFEGHSEPITINPTPHFNMPSGGILKYCDKCYNERYGNMQGGII